MTIPYLLRAIQRNIELLTPLTPSAGTIGKNHLLFFGVFRLGDCINHTINPPFIRDW